MTSLIDLERIQRCINPVTKAIAPGEPFHNVISVVVGAGVYRLKTVALHMRVSGEGSRIARNPRRVDVVATPLDSLNEDWQADVMTLAAYIRGVNKCAVFIDSTALGTQFARSLELQLVDVKLTQWGAKPEKGENWNRFFNLRAQSSVHVAEAIKDGRATITTQTPSEWLKQGSQLLYHVRPDGQYQMATADQRRVEEIPPADCFDALCMAFMEVVKP